MDFSEALKHLKDGKKVRRSKFGTPIMIRGHLITWATAPKNTLDDISCDSLLTNDWEIYEEPGMTFPEAMQCLVDGKVIRRRGWGRGVYVVIPCGETTSKVRAVVPACSCNWSPSVRDVMGNNWAIASSWDMSDERVPEDKGDDGEPICAYCGSPKCDWPKQNP